MPDGAHAHDTSGAGLQDQHFFVLEPNPLSHCVIFAYVGKDRFHCYFEYAAALPPSILETNAFMLFKVPANYSATFKILEVANGFEKNHEGRYLLEMHLHPPGHTVAARQAAVVKADFELMRRHQTSGEPLLLDLGAGGEPLMKLNSGRCISEVPECGLNEPYSPCNLGEIVKKVDETCGCHLPFIGPE